MKKLILFFLFISFGWMLQGQTSKTVNVTAGTLSEVITNEDISTVTSLKLRGTMDARDFRYMREKLVYVSQLDLSEVNIVAYKGIEGTYDYEDIDYPANRIPQYAFRPWELSITLNLSSVIFPASLKSIGICAFDGCFNLKSVTIPSSIRKIEAATFRNCVGLTSLTVPSTVDTIDVEAFAGCKGLTSLNLPSTITYIGSGAFMNCVGLTSVTIPPSITAIGSAFSYCTGLTQITIPNAVTVLEDGAFEGCTGLTSIIIPQGVTTIHGHAFSKCTGLTSITIPSKVTTIGEYIFSECTNLTTVSILSPTIWTNNWMFANCSKITSLRVSWTAPPTLLDRIFNSINRPNCALQVPFGTASIYKSNTEWNRFKSITETSSGLYIGTTDVKLSALSGSTASIDVVTNLPWTASSDQSWLTVSPASGTSTTKLIFTAQGNLYVGSRTAKVILSSPGLTSQIITVIQNSADALLSNVTPGSLITRFTAEQLNTITILRLKGSIDARDFKTMRDHMPLLAELDLSEVTIAAFDGLNGTNEQYMGHYPANTIPEYAFHPQYGSSKTTLNSVIFPSTLTGFGQFSFQGCSNLKSLNIPALVNSIGIGSFGGCSSLKSLTIPSNVTKIEASAFIGCSGLMSLELPSTITSIGMSAFQGCSSLTSIELPSSITVIEVSTFSDCTALTSVNIPSSITTISDFAFANCTGLTSVHLPNSITSIGGAFRQCTALTSIILPESVTTLENYAFSQCTGLSSITIPASVTIIGGNAFSYCENLKSVTILSKNIDIWDVAFSNCNNLTTVAIHSLSATLGNTVFSYCPKMTSITLACAIPPKCGSYTFYMADRNLCTLNVPYGTIPRYAEVSPWKEFINRKEMPGFFLSANTAKLEAAQGSIATVDIKSNVEWTATSDHTWLTVDPASGTGLGQKLTFTSQENTLTKPRKAIVTISAPGIVTQEVTITQMPAEMQVELTAGALSSVMTIEELNTITDLAITGTIDARDFKTMRDKMPLLAHLDLSGTKIIEYIGNEGTNNWGSTTYSANTIPPNAFNKDPEGKINLTSILLPESITGIGECAFSLCKGLTKVTIPSLVTSIKEQAFAYCTGLKSITIENSIPPVLTSSNSVFYQVDKSLCPLNVPYGSAADYRNAYQWRDFYHIAGAPNGFHISSNKVNVVGAAGSSATILLSSNVEWTASSDQNWLSVNPNTGNDSIEITFTAEENPSFLNARTASVIVSSPGVKSQTITVTQSSKPQPPKTLKINAGGLTSALTEEELSTITDLTLTGSIDARDFKTLRDKMPRMARLNLSGVTIVAYSGTEGTRGIESTSYPANMIPDYAMLGNNNYGNFTFTNIVFPESLTAIGQYSYTRCYALQDVVIPPSVSSIDTYAFYSCTRMLNISIPSSVTTIGLLAFGGLKAVINVDPANVHYMSSNSVLYNKTQTELIQWPQYRSGNFEIPSTVKTIGDYAFYNSSALTSVTIPSSVTTIGRYAFYYCNGLTTLTIPSSVASIGEYAFYSCYGLRTLYAYAKTPVNLDASPEALSQIYSCILYVHVGSKAAYQTASQWKNFWTIIEVNPDLIANAGPDKEFDEGTLITLEGSFTVHTSGKPLTYKWIAPQGITLSSDIIANPTFTAPDVVYSTDLTFSLIISDGLNYSTADQVVIVVRNIPKPPVANAGADQTVNENSQVYLDGSASLDPDNNTLSYHWTAPEGISLSSNYSNKPIFKAPEVTTDTDFIFFLQVRNGYYSSIDIIVVKVKQVNKAPIAYAGDMQIKGESETVTLDGSGSRDPEGDALTYLWIAPEGITLSSVTNATPSFTAPEVDIDTHFTFTLTVKDNENKSSTAEVIVMVRNIYPVLKLTSNAIHQPGIVYVNYKLFKKVEDSFIQKVDTFGITGEILYIFLEPGEWTALVLPARDPSAFVPTYSGDVLNWEEATVISLQEKSIEYLEINCMKPSTAPTGSGQISGYVYEKAAGGTKSISLIREQNLQFASPVPNALVRLYKKDSPVPLAYVKTDYLGAYLFDKLAMADYEIKVEIPGYIQSERFPVAITNNAPATNIWFAVNMSTKVITDNHSLQVTMLRIYPNPTAGIIHINGLSGKAKMAVYTMDGKLIIKKESVQSDATIDLTSQVPGTYVLVVNEQRFKILKK